MAKHKNILLLVADDLGKNLSCYGARNPQTPCIDQLAADGTRFDKAFTSTASCSCSRSVIYTGLHTHENGMWGLSGGKGHFQCFQNVESAPKLFNDIGYLTGIIGKIHVGPPEVFPWQIIQETNKSGEEAWSRDTAQVADKAEAFFKKAKDEDKPFFLTVGYIDPHRHSHERSGFGNKEGYDSRIKDVLYDPKDVEIPRFLSDVPEVREELAEYYRSINRMDQGVGIMMEKLKNNGILNDTLVIFLSDNGAPFINSKTTLYDAGVCLPLIIRQPGQKSGILNPNLISYIDLLPSMLDWAGHNDKKGIRLGRSILPILDSSNEEEGWDHVFGSHTLHEITNYWPTRFMRNKRFKYHRNLLWKTPFPFASDLYMSLAWEGIRNSSSGDGNKIKIGSRPLQKYLNRPAEELYDLELDPEEVISLAGNPGYEEVLVEMREKTEKWQLKTKDTFVYRDGVSLMAVKGYVDRGQKIDLPDRFDMDGQRPGNKGGPFVKWEGEEGVGVSSGWWTSD